MATKILVVDDEPQIHRFLKPSLAVAGYEVVSALTERWRSRRSARRNRISSCSIWACPIWMARM